MNKKQSKSRTVGIWMTMGMCFGVAFGKALGDPAKGLVFGMVAGIIIGTVLGNRSEEIRPYLALVISSYANFILVEKLRFSAFQRV